MKTSMKLGMLVLLCLFLLPPTLLACGGGGDGNGAPQTSTVDGKPVPTGTLMIAMRTVNTAPFWSPFSRNGTDSRPYVSAMADYLLYVKRDGSGFFPGLAQEWEIAPDKKSVTFKLRQGVQFHDGWGELTAGDVKFTFETALNPDIGEYQEAIDNVAHLIDRIETSGQYEVTFYLTRAFAEEFLLYVSPSQNVSLPVTCEAYYEQTDFDKANKTPIYSGPYKFVSWTMGDRLIMEAVDDHWRVIPEFKKIVVREVPELITRVAMLETGEADVVDVNIEQAANLESKGYDVTRLQEAGHLEVALGGQWYPSRDSYDSDLPWLDKRVREAMNIAINRQEIADYLYKGYATPVGAFMPTPFFEDNPLEPYPYDPDRAQELLAEAGYENGFKVEMWDIAFGMQSTEMSRLLLAVASYWEEIGLNVEISPYVIFAVYGQIVARDTTGVVWGFTHPVRGEPYALGIPLFVYSQSNAMPHYESEEIDRLIEQFKAANTPEERDEYTKQILQHLYDEYAVVPLVAVDRVWATSDEVGSWRPSNIFAFYWEYITHKEPLGTFRLFEP